MRIVSASHLCPVLKDRGTIFIVLLSQYFQCMALGKSQGGKQGYCQKQAPFTFYLPLIKTAVSQPVQKFKSSLDCCEIVMFILTSLDPNLNRMENIETPKRLKIIFFVKKC